MSAPHNFLMNPMDSGAAEPRESRERLVAEIACFRAKVRLLCTRT
jgi:hypothetical protein